MKALYVIEILALTILHTGAVLLVLLHRNREPSATLAWLFAVILVPIAGPVAYVLVGRTRVIRERRRGAEVDERVRQVLANHGVLAKIGDASGAEALPGHLHSVLTLGEALSSTPASRDNRVKLLRDAANTYAEMRRAIEGAHDHIHVAFYIFQPDEVGRRLRDLLVARARDGLQVRVLVDGIGSFRLPEDFWRPLVEAGGQAAVFNPVRFRFLHPARRDRIDFRNHRKIVVVDGRTAFTGGINVGREYLGLDPDVGHWRDTHIRLDGPAALSVQLTFLHDWLATTDELFGEARHFPEPPPAGDRRGCVVHVLDSGPDRPWPSIALLQQHAIELARQRVWVTSPYFVPNRSLLDALLTAALRNVDVRLLLPARSDHRVMGAAARSYYPELLRAGVRIFEYGRGFVHAKTLVVDDWMGVVGSANMDQRSFDLNYELNAIVLDPTLTAQLAGHYLDDLGAATEIDLPAACNIPLWRRLGRAAARVLSPIL